MAKVVDDVEELLAFYELPAEHWIHLKTSNAIESTFSTVRAQEARDEGPGLPGCGTGDGVQAARGGAATVALGERPHLVALVRAGAKFEKGVLIERPNEQDQEAAA